MSHCEDCQNKNNDPVDATPTKRPIGDGPITTTVATTVGMRQGNALLKSTSLAWFMSLPV